jgi:hypothetical protein
LLLQDVALDVIVIVLARRAFDDVARKRWGVVGIRRRRPGRKDPLGYREFQIVAQQFEILGIGDE